MGAENKEQRPQISPESEIKRAVTPETARVMAGTVLRTYLNPEIKPDEKFKDRLMEKKPEDIDYQPLQKISEQSRRENPNDYQSWNKSVADNIKYYAGEDSENRDEYIATLGSLGMEIDKDNPDNELSGKIDTFYKEYLNGKSEIQKFVGRIADDCKDDQGHTDVKKLESRLQTIKSLLTSFGRNEDAIPQLIEGHAKAQAILSQDEEKKREGIDAAVEQMGQPIPDNVLRAGFEKLASIKPEAKDEASGEVKATEPKTDEAEKRYKELVEADTVLSVDELSDIKKKIADPNTPEDEKKELKTKRDQTRFKTEDFDQMKAFSKLFFKENETANHDFIEDLEEKSASDRAAKIPVIYAMELSKDENGIYPRPIVIANESSAPKPEEPADRKIEDIKLPEPDAADTKPEADKPAEPAPALEAPIEKPQNSNDETKTPEASAIKSGEKFRFNGENYYVTDIKDGQVTLDPKDGKPVLSLSEEYIKEQLATENGELKHVANEEDAKDVTLEENQTFIDTSASHPSTVSLTELNNDSGDATIKHGDGEEDKLEQNDIKNLVARGDFVPEAPTSDKSLEKTVDKIVDPNGDSKTTFVAEPTDTQPQKEPTEAKPTEEPKATAEQPSEPEKDEPQKEEKFKIGDEVMYMTPDLTGTIKERHDDEVTITLKKNGEDLRIKWENLVNRGELVKAKDASTEDKNEPSA